jgi:hypothetical protein
MSDTLTIGQVYNLLRQAGFSPTQAADMTAIAIAESGLHWQIKGDIALENNTYGPSVGLFQVRTVKAETGKGTDRDVNALLGSPARQARAAYDISNGGRNFKPWSTWLHGSAQAQIARVYSSLGAGHGGTLPGTADAAPAPSGSGSAGGGGSTDAQNAGLISTPISWLGKLLGLDDVKAEAAKVAIFTGVFATGAALVVIGAWRSVQPAVSQVRDTVQQGAETAAQIGVMAA